MIEADVDLMDLNLLAEAIGEDDRAPSEAARSAMARAGEVEAEVVGRWWGLGVVWGEMEDVNSDLIYNFPLILL